MDEIVTFLAARYDEGERYAQVMAEVGNDVAGSAGDDAYAAVARILIPLMSDSRVKREMASWMDRGISPPNDLRHIHRVIAAARKRLEIHQPEVFKRYGRDETCCAVCVTDHEAYMDDDHPDPWPCETIRADLSVHSDHPDYRAEWALSETMHAP